MRSPDPEALSHRIQYSHLAALSETSQMRDMGVELGFTFLKHGRRRALAHRGVVLGPGVVSGDFKRRYVTLKTQKEHPSSYLSDY